MSIKRYSFLLKIIAALFALLLIRVSYLQFVKGGSLLKAATSQREINVPIERIRGDIRDRNGIPFTNNDRKNLVVIKTSILRGRDNDIQNLAEILKIDGEQLKSDIELNMSPIIREIDEPTRNALLSSKIDGASVIYTLSRYGSNSVAKHINGYVAASSGIGETGIEKVFENTLKISGKSNIGAVTDARNNLIKGLGYRVFMPQISNKQDVKLTLDYHIQKIVEDVMDRNAVTGAVVVEDISNGDVVAIASKPDFDQNNVGDYLNSDKRELFNRAVASYNLGSIFKIIDVSLFYENGYDQTDEYFCSGSIKIGDTEFKCQSYASGGHGMLDITKAFEVSCNPWFINLGQKIGFKNLIKKAESFGLGKATGIKEQGMEESSGKLPNLDSRYSLGDVANISIGQGEIMVTPLQVANLVATIANGGIKHTMNIVDSITDRDGNIIKSLRNDRDERVISKYVADKVKYLMEQVTMNGSGTKAALTMYGGSGGKTGTAETGQFIDGIQVVHAWFAGFFPQKSPKYSIAVFVENGKSGGQVAAPIFEQIAEEISKKGF